MDRESKLLDPKFLRTLQYFEVVARLGSVNLAAREIGVSASAVSHQLSDLAELVGEDLIAREGRGIRVTDAGHTLAEKLAVIFGNLNSTLGDAIGQERSILRLAVCSSFGPAWLAPRLSGFLCAHPNIDLELRLYAEQPDQTHLVADVIVTARPVKPGFDAVFLFNEMLVAVQKPLGPRESAPERQPLITTDTDPMVLGQDWQDFARACQTPLQDWQEGPWLRCTHYMLALELAKAGVGVALVPDFLATEALERGTLTPFQAAKVPSGRVYNLSFKSARASEVNIRALARWMKSQVLPAKVGLTDVK